VPLGAALLVTPFIYEAASTQTVASIVSGLALIVLSYRRGSIHEQYGTWQALIR
jgi:hypothetical protein